MTAATISAVSEPASHAAIASPSGRRWSVAVAYAIILAVVGTSIWGGLLLRRWAWEQTTPVRFLGDINNAFRWGTQANAVGYLRVYDDLLAAHPDSNRYGLDYTPMRLLVVTLWVRWLQQTFPGEPQWVNDYAHTWPMLYFNIACQLASMAAMFLLVRLWVRRSSRSLGDGTSEIRAAILGAVAALLLWFNPAIIWNGHCWPQWDIWCVPFFLWAILLASMERWLLAGALIAVGAMFKGQVLLVSPIFLLWPLFGGRIAAALRFMLGVVLGAGVVVSPWLVRDGEVALWLAGLVLIGAAAVGLVVRQRRWGGRAAVTTVLAWATACLWLTATLHDGSFAWFHVGFMGPQENHHALTMGPVYNLAGMLGHDWQWRLDDPVALAWLGGWTPTIRTLLIIAYAIPLIACGVAASRLDRHRDPRFLLAAIGPWVFMFTLMPQMHERYLLWAAACTAAWVALGVGPLLLHLAITAIAWAMMAQSMLGSNRRWAPEWWRFLRELHPDAAWALIAMAVALLVMMYARRPKAEG